MSYFFLKWGVPYVHSNFNKFEENFRISKVEKHSVEDYFNSNQQETLNQPPSSHDPVYFYLFFTQIKFKWRVIY